MGPDEHIVLCLQAALDEPPFRALHSHDFQREGGQGRIVKDIVHLRFFVNQVCPPVPGVFHVYPGSLFLLVNDSPICNIRPIVIPQPRVVIPSHEFGHDVFLAHVQPERGASEDGLFVVCFVKIRLESYIFLPIIGAILYMAANVFALVSKAYLFPVQERPYLLFRKDVLPPFPLKTHRILVACAVFPHAIHIISHRPFLLVKYSYMNPDYRPPPRYLCSFSYGKFQIPTVYSINGVFFILLTLSALPLCSV